MNNKERIFWMAIRKMLIDGLCAIEDYLGLQRTIAPKKKRRQEWFRASHQTDFNYDVTAEN